MSPKYLRKILSWGVLIFGLLLVQHFLILISNGKVAPNLLILVVIFLAAYYPKGLGIIAVFALGLINDAFQPGIIGVSSAVLIIIFFVLSLLAKRLYLESRLVIGVVAFVLQVFFNFCYFLITNSLFAPAEINWWVISSGVGLGLAASVFYGFIVKFYLTPGIE